MADGSGGSHETCCRDGDGDWNDSLYGGCMPCTPHPMGSESMKPGSNDSKTRNILKIISIHTSIYYVFGQGDIPAGSATREI